jgi:hypothetical protein
LTLAALNRAVSHQPTERISGHDIEEVKKKEKEDTDISMMAARSGPEYNLLPGRIKYRGNHRQVGEMNTSIG